MKKRRNGTGSAVYLGKGRHCPWAARIVVGKKINGTPIYYDINTFESELDALVCLENYHKNPTALYINENKYNLIVTFPKNPYPLVPVKNPNQEIVEKIKIDNYTFKQLYERFEEEKMLTKEEEYQEKIYHIRAKGKPFGRNYCRTLRTAYHNSEALYDKVYKDLRASDFNDHIKSVDKSVDSQRQLATLYKKLDEFALEEDIIQKGYAQFITAVSSNKKEIKNSKNKIEKNRVFSYQQINYLWNFTPRGTGSELKREREIFIRDFWLMLIYTGMRADELLSIYTANVFLDKNYFIGGLKTNAGINREVPIHPSIKPLFEKYYNSNNEFLFTQPNGKKIDYDYYLYHYRKNFKQMHPEVSEHTAHDARHTLRNELRKLRIDDMIINSIIGHSNDDVGKDIYSHVSIEEKLKAIMMVDYKEKNNIYVLASNQ